MLPSNGITLTPNFNLSKAFKKRKTIFILHLSSMVHAYLFCFVIKKLQLHVLITISIPPFCSPFTPNPRVAVRLAGFFNPSSGCLIKTGPNFGVTAPAIILTFDARRHGADQKLHIFCYTVSVFEFVPLTSWHYSKWSMRARKATLH